MRVCPQPLKIYLHFNLHAIAQREGDFLFYDSNASSSIFSFTVIAPFCVAVFPLIHPLSKIPTFLTVWFSAILRRFLPDNQSAHSTLEKHLIDIIS